MSTTGTPTRDGLIPFWRHQGVDMPVALNIPPKAPAAWLGRLQEPLRIDGHLVYVAPGGELVANIEPDPGRVMTEAYSQWAIGRLTTGSHEEFKRMYMNDEVFTDAMVDIDGGVRTIE